MHRCGISLFRGRLGLWLAFILILMMASFMVHAFARFAQAQVPLEGQSEIIEKSLRQSLPKELPPKPKSPKIINKSKPSPGKAPVTGPTFFIKKIKLTGNTITLNISIFTGGITLHYDNVLPPDNTDIALAKQVTFAELDFAIDQNIAKIYGSYEEMQDDILWMYKLFRDRFPEQEQSLEVVHQPQPKQVKIRKIKANTNKNDVSEAKEL